MNLKRAIVCLMIAAAVVFGVGTEAEAAQKYSSQDLKIMSAIIYCEAGGQSYAGKLAVGCVIMNRKKSSRFPNTIKGVVYQRSQFGPARSGMLHKELVAYKNGKYKYGNRASCVKAAKAALRGERYVVSKGRKINMKRYHFFNGSLSKAKVRIGGHDFK